VTEDTIDVAARRLPQPEHEFFSSLFYEPIKWWPGAKRMSNGQHRACGLILGGASPGSGGPRSCWAKALTLTDGFGVVTQHDVGLV
jgi:hypothetical protein